MEFPFELSPFQKTAIAAIDDGNHVLVTAHTGSGKTLPAEYAIRHFTAKGKRVIYTAPIKALSNQKFYEFQKQFPEISFGILTGDIKFNPEADVLIMTTEILKNTLYLRQLKTTQPLDFEMDIETDLGCVVFDEVHYINDPDRGKVWEETIIMLPHHVQMVMLSATIDAPKRFCQWIESVKQCEDTNKKVILTGTNERVVPLVHYTYVITPHKVECKDKSLLNIMLNQCNTPQIIKGGGEDFDLSLYNAMKKLLEYQYRNKTEIKCANVLNSLVRYLKQNNMLPAICFVFSRKQAERMAFQIDLSLFDVDTKQSQIVEQECKHIIMRLPNYKEYIELPEYRDAISLLEKGIAVHHSGVAPVLREMIELLFSKGYIKLLFATETFAVGINMPTKTVVFTGFSKYDGKQMRLLRSHEYTQMAGRAGRRGLDTIGHVIHCLNMFELPYVNDYQEMLNGKAQTFRSKFKISYHIIFNVLEMLRAKGEPETKKNQLDAIINLVSKSMINNEINAEMDTVKQTIKKLEVIEKQEPNYKTDIDVLNEYISCKNAIGSLSNKKRSRMKSRIIDFETGNHRFLMNDYEQYNWRQQLMNDIKKERKYVIMLETYIMRQVEKTIEVMIANKFIACDDEGYKINNSGNEAMKIQETHPLVLSDLLRETNYFFNFTCEEVISLCSCFANVTIPEQVRQHCPTHVNSDLERCAERISELFYKYEDQEQISELYTGSETYYQYDLMKIMLDWCGAKTEFECKMIIQTVGYEKDIFLGEFVKALLKIMNVIREIQNVAKINNIVHLEHKLSECDTVIMKYVVTTQSLYV
jgi:superfamily II RNA helicase